MGNFNILMEASDTSWNKNLYKTENALSEYNILQSSSELTSIYYIKTLKFPMLQHSSEYLGLGKM